jgi:hypothetical protein
MRVVAAPAQIVRRVSVSCSRRQSLSSTPRLLVRIPDNMSEYFNSMLAYLRIPVLASSGIAALLSGLLYFKQTYVYISQLSHLV